MHEFALRSGFFHKFTIDLEPVESGVARFALFLLSRVHGGPDIAVDHVRALHRVVRVVPDFDGGNTSGLRAFQELRIRLEPDGTAAYEVNRIHRGELDPGMHDVVPVTDVHYLFTLYLSEGLFYCEGIRHDLARVVEVSQPVDDRDGSVLG